MCNQIKRRGDLQNLREADKVFVAALGRAGARFSNRFHTCLPLLALPNDFKDLGFSFQAKESPTRQVFRIETTENQPIRTFKNNVKLFYFDVVIWSVLRI